MRELKPRIHDEETGLDYILAGDYYIPDIELLEDDDRPIGKWGRMHRAYLEKTTPLLLNHLILTGKLHTYLLQYNSDGTLGSQPGVSSVSCQSYNKGSNWLTIPTLGYEGRRQDCQPSSCCSVRFKQVEP